MTNTPYLIGIDGGGTSCRVAVASPNGTILGTAKGGSANVRTNWDAVVKTVSNTILAAVQDAGLDPDILTTAQGYGGFAGVHNDDIASRFAAALPLENIHITEDRATTMAGALGEEDGAVAAIGTGSFIGHTLRGRTRYVGGWGFHIGDQASGAWLGKQLIRTVMLTAEGIDSPSQLSRDVLSEFNDNPHDLYEFAQTATPADYAKFAPDVVIAGKNKDAIGKRLMATGAAYLSKAMIALKFSGQSPLCLVGGVGPHYADYLLPQFKNAVTPPKGTALDGALYLAGKLAQG